jgi:tRNA dimethylallyltransferase
MDEQTKKPLLVIVGETASGKSALALEIAERFDGEIITADAWTVRREANIGTSKPSKEDLARVPHHLVDVVGPDEEFTAAIFKRLADQAMKDTTDRGKLPILAGGTGLYIDGVIYDYSFLPGGDREARQVLNDLTPEELIEKAVQAGYDLTGIDTRNKRRVIRLLENEGVRPSKGELRRDTLIIGLSMEREVLKERIEARTDQMIDNGLEQEVKDLAERFGWEAEALKAIGYREWQPYVAGEQGLEEVRERIIKDTLDLAKRQRTWFKRNKSIHWHGSTASALTEVGEWLNKYNI